MNNVLTEKVKELSIVLNDKQIQQFEQYYNILVEWNKVMNLTAITEYEEVVEKHFLDSLTIVNAIQMEKIETLIDVGTGAGFPMVQEYLENAGGAAVLLEKDCSGQALFQAACGILHDGARRASMERAMSALGIRDATERIYQTVLEICQ